MLCVNGVPVRSTPPGALAGVTGFVHAYQRIVQIQMVQKGLVEVIGAHLPAVIAVGIFDSTAKQGGRNRQGPALAQGIQFLQDQAFYIIPT